jgi:hypothetical protein
MAGVCLIGGLHLHLRDFVVEQEAGRRVLLLKVDGLRSWAQI